MKRPLVLYPLLFLHLMLGTSALYGGWMLMTDPVAFGMNPAWLNGAPFGGYFLPGLILFVLLGLFPLFTFWGLIVRPAGRRAGIFNLYPERHWAWTYSLFSGLTVMIWITVQMVFIPAFWLQPVFMTTGLLILILTLWPSVMRHFLN